MLAHRAQLIFQKFAYTMKAALKLEASVTRLLTTFFHQLKTMHRHCWLDCHYIPHLLHFSYETKY